MTRLTNDTRDAIQSAAIKHAFADRTEKLANEQACIASAIYNDVLSAKDRKMIDSLPAGWLTTNSCIQASVESDYMMFYFSGGFTLSGRKSFGLRLSRETVWKPVPFCFSGQCVKVYGVDERIGQDMLTFKAECATLIEAQNEAANRIRTTLASFHTVAKLIEAWPEIEQFVPTGEKPKPSLPALPVSDLNKLLNL